MIHGVLLHFYFYLNLHVILKFAVYLLYFLFAAGSAFYL